MSENSKPQCIFVITRAITYNYITSMRNNVRKVSRNDLLRWEKFLRAGLLDSVTAVKSRMASVFVVRQSLRQSEAVSLSVF